MYFTKKFTTKLFRLGTLLVILLVILDLLTYFFYPDTEIGKIFLATREQTPLTWVSSLALLLIALSCATVYMKTKSRLWYLLSLLFLFFSMDDAVYFHERFSAAVQEMIPFLARFPSYSWVIIYLPFLVFGLGVLAILLWRKSDKDERRILIAAIVLLVISLTLDMIDGWVGKDAILVFCIDKRCDAITTHLFRLSEEVIEVIAFGGLAYLNVKKNATLG